MPFQWRIQDFPLGGGGGADLRHVHFSAKTYAKTKEIEPANAFEFQPYLQGLDQ